MAGAAKEITLEQLPAWLTNAQRLLNTASFKAAWKGCRQVMASGTKLNFQKAAAPDGTAWKPLKWRSGKPLYDKGLLVGSITATNPPVNVESDVSLVWGTNLDYAATHQDGATIVPKAAKALAIPVTNAARRSGGPTRMGDLHLVWPKGRPSGTLRDDAGKVQFVLVKSVTIPARPFMGWTEDMAEQCGDVITTVAQRVIDGA